MYCGHCGIKIEAEDLYCPECESPQQVFSHPEEVQREVKPVRSVNENKKKPAVKNWSGRSKSLNYFRRISVVLIVIMAMSAAIKLLPFGGGNGTTKSIESETVAVSYAEPFASLAGIQVDVNRLNLTDGDRELKVEKFKENVGEDGFTGVEYDISLGDQHYLRAPLSFALPYDKKAAEAFSVCLLHYDQDMENWIPLDTVINEEEGTVTGKLTSLSPVRLVYFDKDYSGSLYYIENKGKTNAMMKVSYDYWDHIKNTPMEPASIVANDYVINGNTLSSTAQMMKEGNDAINTVNTYYTLFGALGDTMLSTVNLLAPLGGAVSHVTGTLSKGVGVVSLFIAGTQLMFDLGSKESTGPQNETAINLYKNLATNAGTLYSFSTGYSSAALSFGFFAVAVTGYALDSMIEEAKTIQANTVESIFTTYYQDYSSFNEEDWYTIFVDAYWDAWQNNRGSEEGMTYAIKKVTDAIDQHAEKFWTEIYKDGTDALTFAVAEAGQKNYFTPTKDQKAELTANFKKDLFTRFNDKAMPWINEFMQERMKDGVYSSLLSTVEPLNDYYSVQIQEIAPQDGGDSCKYQKCPLRFGTLNGLVISDYPEEWEIQAPEDDDEWAVKKDFIMMGYITVGGPDKVFVFNSKEKDVQFGQQIREEVVVLNLVEEGGLTLIDLSETMNLDRLVYYEKNDTFEYLKKRKEENDSFDQVRYALYETGYIEIDKEGKFTFSGTGPGYLVTGEADPSGTSTRTTAGPMNVQIVGEIDLNKLDQAIADEKSNSSVVVGTGNYSHEGNFVHEYLFSRGNFEKAEYTESANCPIEIYYVATEQSLTFSSQDYFEVNRIGTYTSSYDGDVTVGDYDSPDQSYLGFTFKLE